ncbi:MAG: hypothetical protein WDN28_07570 [Chthoniobacter sp.]
MITTLTATSAHTAAMPASHGVACLSRRTSGVLAGAWPAFCTGLADAVPFLPPAPVFGKGVRRIFSTSLFISPVFA